MSSKTLETRALEVYEEMNEQGQALADGLYEYFTDYFTGERYEMHPDMSVAIREAEIDESQKRIVKEYASLRCTQHALPSVISDFVQQYERLKHDIGYTLEHFLLTWNSQTEEMARGDSLGTYSPLLVYLAEHLERTQELENFAYGDFSGFGEDSESFTKWGLISIIANNFNLITDIALSTISGQEKQNAEDIIYGRRLAKEAGEAFLDAYPNHRKSTPFRKGLGEFLDRFDLETDSFATKRTGGQYRPLLHRLKNQNGVNWRNAFYDALDEPIKTRVIMLDQELGKSGIREEDRIRFIERLASEDLFKYLHLLQDEGTDADDLLLASRLSSLDEEDRELLKDITRKRKKSVGKYLGVCRIPSSDNEVKYDARRALKDICLTISPQIFAQNDTLATILLTKTREQYDADFVRDQDATLTSLREEINTEDSEIRRGLLEQTLAHYELRKQVRDVKGIVKKLVVIK